MEERDGLISLISDVFDKKIEQSKKKYDFFSDYFWVGEVDTYDSGSNTATVLLPNQTTPLTSKQNKTLQSLDAGDFVLLFSPQGTLGSSFIAWAGKQYSTGSPISSGVDSVNTKTGVVSLNSDDIPEGTSNFYFSEERTQDTVGDMVGDTETIMLSYDDSGNAITADAVSDSINQRVGVEKDGSDIGTRRAINYIEGVGVTLTVEDDSINNRINLTISSTSTGVGSVFGRTGDIIAVDNDYTADQINDTFTTKKFVTSVDKATLYNLTISSPINLDTMETDVTANNAKNSYPSADSAKLAGIEDGAEVNNMSDSDATELTDGSETTLHTCRNTYSR